MWAKIDVMVAFKGEVTYTVTVSLSDFYDENDKPIVGKLSESFADINLFPVSKKSNNGGFHHAYDRVDYGADYQSIVDEDHKEKDDEDEDSLQEQVNTLREEVMRIAQIVAGLQDETRMLREMVIVRRE
ncbi:hypothetical protein Pmar_PMAR023607 [Perkinsus marinus ATCC 50983]|uniref:Uncharacterized protein n=1 Tax=Perkinsus marinus (strain ATCC 50983 / TXsc) TaxID=423536 RepID=C5KCT7_PERM5|nr:hypothetical protein Pmar_PMAR023607 [Perkinsus marinus ATCC 50983]EER17686.1 hypothetical protein Pmar_PMAR023607 [Perkinsus marinus ATCC 50983]|eukprot:XP_002785890.1 hypothetical protein Pmar_PMAR023607 [Perkinsus marinus ATCC 50983]